MLFCPSNVRITKSQKRVVIGFRSEDFLWIKGMAGIRVYCGVIRILGSQLKPDGTYHPCYAPKQSSALKIEPIVDTSVKRLSLSRLPHIADKKEELEAERLARDLASQFPIVAVFQALQIDYTNLDCFVDAPLGFQFIGQSNTEEIDRFVAFNPGRKLEFLTSWSDVSAKMTTKRLKIGRIMIAGAKGVGKSTFGRYLINQLLQVTPVLAYLDTDVGQPEFTAPGMISLQLITQPLLGPGHTHMKQPFRSYHYGYISCKSDPQKFMSLVRLAMADYTSKWSSSIPLIVNTDGWIKGMGLDILSSSVHSVQPTDLIQIEGITAATTLDLVVPENVQVHRIDAWTESTGASSSKFDRHCRLRSYFLAQEELGENASLIASNPDRMNLCTSIELSRLVPHEISFKRLRIHFPGHTVRIEVLPR